MRLRIKATLAAALAPGRGLNAEACCPGRAN